MLFTGLNFVLTLGCCLCVYAAYRHACDAHESGQELRREYQKLALLRDELAQLDARFQRLAGRVYAQSRKPVASAPPAADGVLSDEEIDPDWAAEIALQSAPAASPGSKPKRGNA